MALSHLILIRTLRGGDFPWPDVFMRKLRRGEVKGLPKVTHLASVGAQSGAQNVAPGPTLTVLLCPREDEGEAQGHETSCGGRSEHGDLHIPCPSCAAADVATPRPGPCLSDFPASAGG